MLMRLRDVMSKSVAGAALSETIRRMGRLCTVLSMVLVTTGSWSELRAHDGQHPAEHRSLARSKGGLSGYNSDWDHPLVARYPCRYRRDSIGDIECTTFVEDRYKLKSLFVARGV